MTSKQYQFIQDLFLDMYDKLLSYALASLKDQALAEEAVQEAFQIACQKPANVCASPNPRGWITNTLKNVISNTKRRNETAQRFYSKLTDRHSETILTPPSPSFEVEYADIASTDEFMLLKAITIDGKSQLELATELGISLSACKKRIQRAKAFLRNKLN